MNKVLGSRCHRTGERVAERMEIVKDCRAILRVKSLAFGNRLRGTRL